MYAREMDNNDTQLRPIPIELVIEQGLKEHTEVKRRPYRELITTWAEREGMSELGETIASQLNTGKGPERLKDLRNLPDSVAHQYRTGDKAEQLVMIIREIDAKVRNDSNWTWALVMKVMLDEGLITTNIRNKFDVLICKIVEGKGLTSVRNNGDYTVLEDSRSWIQWISNSHDNWEEAIQRSVCEEIYQYFKPLLNPKPLPENT